MAKAKILVVEDESIIAKYIQTRLQNLGYDVPMTTARGDDAILMVRDSQPDLVLMDITLRGGIDGVDAAETIRSLYRTPIVYLTAHSDRDTLQRAKITEPIGYLLKPFEEHELEIAVEMALYKHRMDRKLVESQHLLATLLHTLNEAVIAADAGLRITYLNPAAELLTGWRQDNGRGKLLTEVLLLSHELTGAPVADPAAQAARERLPVTVPPQTVLTGAHGQAKPISLTAAPVVEDESNVIALVVVFHEVSSARPHEQAVPAAGSF